MTATDPVVKGLLARVARCDVDALAVLIDYLEETEHPLARKARLKWNRAQQWIAFWRAKPDDHFRRCRWLRWQRVTFNWRWLRDEVAKLFGKKGRWAFYKAPEFAALNEHSALFRTDYLAPKEDR